LLTRTGSTHRERSLPRLACLRGWRVPGRDAAQIGRASAFGRYCPVATCSRSDGTDARPRAGPYDVERESVVCGRSIPPAGQRDQLQPSPASRSSPKSYPAHLRSRTGSRRRPFRASRRVKGRYCWLDNRQSALSSRNQDSANRRVASIPMRRPAWSRCTTARCSARRREARQGPVVRLASGSARSGGELAIDDDQRRSRAPGLNLAATTSPSPAAGRRRPGRPATRSPVRRG